MCNDLEIMRTQLENEGYIVISKDDNTSEKLTALLSIISTMNTEKLRGELYEENNNNIFR